MTFLHGFSRVALILSALALVISLINGVLFFVVMTPDQLQPVSGAQGALRFIGAHLRAVAVGFSIYWLLAVVASVALIKGKQWARSAWLGLLALAIAWCVGAVVMEASAITGFGGGDDLRPPSWASSTIVILTCSLSVLFLGWLLRRLARAKSVAAL